jgi:hypothetical protein
MKHLRFSKYENPTEEYPYDGCEERYQYIYGAT